MNKRPDGYWEDWSNVEKHLLPLIQSNHGVMPSYDSMIEAEMNGFIDKMHKFWGGKEKVEKRLGIYNLKYCSTCNTTKDKSNFIFRRRSKGDRISFRFHMCEECYKIKRITWPNWCTRTIGNIRNRAKTKGLAFTIDKEWLQDKIKEQRYKCILTGVDLAPAGDNFSSFSPSVDRIDNRLGYTPDNSRVICNWANIAKGTLSDKELEDMIVKLLVTKGYKVTK